MFDFQSLSPEEKIGQIFFIGLPSAEIDAETEKLLKEIKPGGICIFGRNVRERRQLRNYLDTIRQTLPIEPLLSIDQEGGLVDRLRRVSTPMPSARVIREHGDLAAARELGRVTGEILRHYSFNMNFAPVMEVMTEERDLLSNGLYSRAFGRSPGEVLGYGMVYLRGLQSAGILGCLKHFPGIGAGEVDSHEEMPRVNLTEEELMRQDLAPYIELFYHRQDEDDIVRCVMISHGGFPRINLKTGDLSGMLEPASLNKNIVTRLLRHQLGFRHLAVTDDLEMGAILRGNTIEQAAKKAFDAGEDMILICSSVEAVRRSYDYLCESFHRGELSEERLNEALTRIFEIKSIVRPPLEFNESKLEELSATIAELNQKLNYSYGGRI